MIHKNETFVSKVINKVPKFKHIMHSIEETEFLDESKKLSKLIVHMFENTLSTNGFLNKIIIYTLFNCIFKTIDAEIFIDKTFHHHLQ